MRKNRSRWIGLASPEQRNEGRRIWWSKRLQRFSPERFFPLEETSTRDTVWRVWRWLCEYVSLILFGTLSWPHMDVQVANNEMLMDLRDVSIFELALLFV